MHCPSKHALFWQTTVIVHLYTPPTTTGVGPSYIKTLVTLLHWWDRIWSMLILCGVQDIRKMWNKWKVHRRATELIPVIQDMPYEKRLQFMDLPSLVYRRYRGYGICRSYIWIWFVAEGSKVSSAWEDMNINWRKDDVAHNWQQTSSPSELLIYGIDSHVRCYQHPLWTPLNIDQTTIGQITVILRIQKTFEAMNNWTANRA